MFNNQERVQLVKRSPDADHALTANDTDDDVVIERLGEATRGSTKKHMLWIGFTIAMLIIIGMVSYFIYDQYAANDSHEQNGDINGANTVLTSALPNSLSIDPMELTQKTPTPKLPGIYHISKGYNLYQGKQIYDQSGVDLIDFTYNDIYTMSGAETYEVPVEFRSIPNVEPSCDVHSKVNSVHYISSTSVLKEQSESSSSGFQATIDLKVGAKLGAELGADGGKITGEVTAEASTQLKFGAMFGHSSTSKTAKFQEKSGNEYSFSVETRNTFYKAEIDWSTNNTFRWKQSFLNAVHQLNDDPTNKTIFSFVNKWGSHVLNAMQTGAYCKETAYCKTDKTKSSVEDFQQDVSSKTLDFGYLHHEATESNQEKFSGAHGSDVTFEFSDVYCKGEVAVTSVHCAMAQATSTTNNPIVTSYDPLPIWDIQDIKTILSEQTITNIVSIFGNGGLIEVALGNCGESKCNSHGICILKEEIWSDNFINEYWADGNFSQLVSDVCFCTDVDTDEFTRFEGEDCRQAICDCFNDAGCCCEGVNSLCNGNGGNELCSPIDFMCKAKDATHVGAKAGEFSQCADHKVVIAGCGSGGAADCATKFSNDASTGIVCGYPELGLHKGWSDPVKTCSLLDTDGLWSVPLSCVDNKDIPLNHGLLVGICGSGGGTDCVDATVTTCSESSRIGITCAKIEGIVVNTATCVWVVSTDYGTVVNCPDETYIATGYCGSAGGNDCRCGNNWDLPCHNGVGDGVMVNTMIQCCQLKYAPNPYVQ
eukprot:462382_1